MGASLTVYTSFDDAIRAAGAAANATGATLESLRNKAKHLGATTSFSASEVASLMNELGRAGFSPKQIEERDRRGHESRQSHWDGCKR